MTTIESRSTWGARPPSHGLSQLRYPVADVYVHHEGGATIGADASVDQERARMREIQNGLMGKGYTDFAYGAAVFPSGRAYEGRDLGFVDGGMTAQEAATLGHNENSVATVWPGNYDVQTPTSAQLQATADVIKIAQLAGVVILHPTIWPHSAAYATACPGAHGRDAVPQLRALVEQSPGQPVPTPPTAPTWRLPVIFLPHPERGDWIVLDGPGGKVVYLSPTGAIVPVGMDQTAEDRKAFGSRTVADLVARTRNNGKPGFQIIANDHAKYVPKGQR